MKKKRYYKRIRKRSDGPCRLAWAVLLLAWLCLIPFAASVFLGIRDHGKAAVPAFRAVSAAETLRFVPEQTDTEEYAECNLRFLPAVNALRRDEPTILIYHTHTTEAYTQTEEETYREAGKWRTKDNTRNVVAVGEVLKTILETEYGFRVIHDMTDHEPPKLATAYERSLVTMERYHREYPSIVLFIDLHRDAYSAESAPCDFLIVNGRETARLMLVVGKGDKYTEKPYYASNIAFAERITNHLNTIDSKLCRPIRIKKGRYNQHVAPNCILVEVGHNANTLSQAKAAMPYLAESIAYAFRAGSIPTSDWLPN